MTLGRSKQAKQRKERHQKAVEFFFEHAGWSYDPAKESAEKGRLRGAEALAEAEEYAFNQGFEYSWQQDECIGCDCDSPECACSSGSDHESLCCVLYSATGEVLQSLGSICEPSAEYKRVIKAELALEAMPAGIVK